MRTINAVILSPATVMYLLGVCFAKAPEGIKHKGRAIEARPLCS